MTTLSENIISKATTIIDVRDALDVFKNLIKINSFITSDLSGLENSEKDIANDLFNSEILKGIDLLQEKIKDWEVIKNDN